MKICSKCKKDKVLFEFYRRKKGPRAGEYYEKCKECMKIRGRRYYQANHERQLSLALIRRKRAYFEKRNIINKIKNIPCKDCGKIYPYYVMDFDHRDKNDKINDISKMARSSLNNLMKEIAKCDIVCANCHRIRTFAKHAELAKVVTAHV